MTFEEAVKKQRAATDTAREHRIKARKYLRLAWDHMAMDELKLAIAEQKVATSLHYVVRKLLKEKGELENETRMDS